jgi:hypothetical protein
MQEENNILGMPSEPTRAGLSIVAVNGLRTDGGILRCKVVQCSVCMQQTEYTDGHENCEMCGAGLSSGESAYSGYEPHFVPICPEVYLLTPLVRTVNERRYPRIPCRNVKACVKTALGSSIVVNVVNISRGGVCFTSAEKFCAETPVSIATHYIDGGQNIYQDGRIIRVQRRPTAMLPGEYAIEFLQRERLSSGS